MKFINEQNIHHKNLEDDEIRKQKNNNENNHNDVQIFNILILDYKKIRFCSKYMYHLYNFIDNICYNYFYKK